MITFTKSFEQFKKNIFSLTIITFVYIAIALLSTLILGFFVPGVGPILNSLIALILSVVYMRVVMQVSNDNDLSINKAFKGVLSAIGGLFLLNIIKCIILSVMIIPIILIFISSLVGNIFSETMFVDIMYILGIISLVAIICMVLAIILDLIFGFTMFSIIDEDFATMSLKYRFLAGIKMINGFRGRYILIRIITMFLVLVGCLILGIGVLITYPLAMLLLVNLYKEAKYKYLGYENQDKIHNFYQPVEQMDKLK